MATIAESSVAVEAAVQPRVVLQHYVELTRTLRNVPERDPRSSFCAYCDVLIQGGTQAEASHQRPVVVLMLVPDLGYEGLALSDGQVASIRLMKMIVDGVPVEPDARERLRQDLLAYCQMDTLGMVRLLARLRELAEAAERPD